MQLDPRDVSSGQLSEQTLATAVRTLRDSGMLVLEGLYSRERVAELERVFNHTLATEQDREGSPRVQGTSGDHHVQMQVPLKAPFSDTEVVAHPIIVQVLTAVLGEDPRATYYNSNTAFPGSTEQTVHRDSRPIFGSEFNVATPISSLVLNIPLCDFTEENGSTEVWPATHLIVDDPDNDTRTELDTRAEALASTRLNLPAGAVALRDLRVWHRGMPNKSDRSRSMLALVYTRSWLGRSAPSLAVPQPTWDAWPEHVRSIFRSAPVVMSDESG